MNRPPTENYTNCITLSLPDAFPILTKKTLGADVIASFELKNCDGSSLPHFSAGSHVDVNMANGLGRQYSLCNVPGETDRYLIAVLRDPQHRGGSAFMHDLVRSEERRVGNKCVSMCISRNHDCHYKKK